jgi:hypothetical protein
MKRNFLLLTALCALAITSCKKNNNEVSSKVNIQVQATNAASGVVQWSSGTTNAGLLTITTNSGTSPVSYTTSGTQTSDLFSSQSALGTVNMPAGTFTSPEFKVSLQSNANTSGIVLDGSFFDGTNTVPVIFDLTNDLDIKATTSAINETNGGNYKALISIDLAALMQNISVADLTAAEQNGMVIINGSTNTGLYNLIVANLQNPEPIVFQQN